MHCVVRAACTCTCVGGGMAQRAEDRVRGNESVMWQGRFASARASSVTWQLEAKRGKGEASSASDKACSPGS